MSDLKTIAIAAACFALSCGAASAQAFTASDLNMREGPGTNYAVVGVIPQGAPVDVLGCMANWCEVSYGGMEGYASRGYLDTDDGMTGQMGGALGAGPADETALEDWDDDGLQPGW
jgi:uncharacterized protein YraI